MKKLLLLLLFAICAIGWRSETIMQKLRGMHIVSQARSDSIQLLTVAANPSGTMSLAQYAELEKSDPDAYRKLIHSLQHEPERSEVDKLMNFFTRLKYE